MGMKINEIMDNIYGLSKSQGCWGRLYMDLIEIKACDEEEWKEIVKSLEDENFESLLEMVEYFEEGKSKKAPKRVRIIGYGVNVKKKGDESFERFVSYGGEEGKFKAMSMYYMLQEEEIEYTNNADIEVEEIYLMSNDEFDYEVIATTVKKEGGK